MIEGRRGPGLFASAAALGVILIADFRWYEVLIGWGIAAGICALLKREGTFHLGEAWGIILGVPVIMALLLWNMERVCFSYMEFPLISLILLVLLWKTDGGREETGCRVANTIGMMLLPVLEILLFAGIGNIQICEMGWSGINALHIIVSAETGLLWGWNRRGKVEFKWMVGTGVICTAMSGIVGGTLGGRLAEEVNWPLYRALETVRFFGNSIRLEPMLIIVVVMGMYCMLEFLWETEHTGAKRITESQLNRIERTGILLSVYILELCIYLWGNEMWRGLNTAFWGIWGLLTLWIVIFGKIRKTEKSA